MRKIAILLILALSVSFCGVYASGETDANAAFDRIQALYANFFDWIAGQYSLVDGGFYYAISSRDNRGFRPDIESTSQALTIISSPKVGLKASMPSHIKADMIDYFQSRQIPETGYFIDPYTNMSESPNMVARALSFSQAALSNLGASPLYPLPGQPRTNVLKSVATTAASDSLPSYMQSPEAYGQWLEGLDWNNPWSAGNSVQAGYIYIANLPATEKATYLTVAQNFIINTQNAQTGLWGSNTSQYNSISGAFKLALFLKSFGLYLPNADKIFNSVLKCMREEVPDNLMYPRNAIDLINMQKVQIPQLISDNLAEILRITADNLAIFSKSDGGFSTYPKKSSPTSGGITIGLGLAESDMNAAASAYSAYDSVCSLLGTTKPFPSAYLQNFWGIILNQPYVCFDNDEMLMNGVLPYELSDGNLTFTVDIKNMENSQKTIAVYLALYDENKKLLDLSAQYIDTAGYARASFNVLLQLEEVPPGAYARAYLWDVSKLQPLSNVFNQTIRS